MAFTNFDEIKLTDPESRAEIERIKVAFRNAARLAEVRKETGQTQVDLAAKMGVTQAWVSKIERAQNLDYTTIADYITALGGALEMRVHLPGHEPITFKLPG